MAALALVAAAVLGCGAGSAGAAGDPSAAPGGPSASSLPQATTTTEQDSASIAMPDAPLSDVTLHLVAQQPPGKDVGWDITELSVPAGMRFQVSIDNTDDAKHDFGVVPVAGFLSDLILKTETVKGSASATMIVPGLPAGTYDFICTLHSVEMRGTLRVGHA